ncbi:MAG: hypothetical protein R6W83_08080 [Cryobacterium sp.]
MASRAEPALVSALVVLRAAAGSPATPPAAGAASDAITTENIAQRLPDPVAARTVSSWFADHGFTVAGEYGISLTILGPPEAFEDVFGAAGRTRADFPPRTRLPVHRLPPEIAALVDAVGTPRQPDFGPLP